MTVAVKVTVTVTAWQQQTWTVTVTVTMRVMRVKLYLQDLHVNSIVNKVGICQRRENVWLGLLVSCAVWKGSEMQKNEKTTRYMLRYMLRNVSDMLHSTQKKKVKGKGQSDLSLPCHNDVFCTRMDQSIRWFFLFFLSLFSSCDSPSLL